MVLKIGGMGLKLLEEEYNMISLKPKGNKNRFNLPGAISN